MYQVNTTCRVCGRRYSYRSDADCEGRHCPHPHELKDFNAAVLRALDVEGIDVTPRP